MGCIAAREEVALPMICSQMKSEKAALRPLLMQHEVHADQGGFCFIWQVYIFFYQGNYSRAERNFYYRHVERAPFIHSRMK